MFPAQATDPLLDACGERPAPLCTWVYEHTDGNATLARTVDWMIGKPLAIAGVILVSWILRLITRRWAHRAVRRMLTPSSVTLRLEGYGGVADAVDATEKRRFSRAESLAGAVSSMIAVVIWVAAIFVIVSIIGIDLAPLLAATGIIGVALGFGSQSLVRDCINGLFMLMEDQYGIGDDIDVGQATGVVEGITLRATILRGDDGTVWHVPNGEIRRVGNRTQLWSAAIVDIEVAYDADLTLAKAVLQETADDVCKSEPFANSVLEAPKVLGVQSVAASGVTLRLIVKTAPGAQWALQRALREATKSALDTNGVQMSFTARLAT